MRKILILLAIVLAIWSCGTARLTQNQISKSAWISASPGIVDGVEGNVMMAIFFTSEKDVKVMVSVKSGDNYIVEPYEYARGIYIIDDSINKGNGIKLDLKDIQGKPLIMKGTCAKGKAMLLITNDNVTRLFGKINDVKFD